jgi:hypothetical protein
LPDLLWFLPRGVLGDERPVIAELFVESHQVLIVLLLGAYIILSLMQEKL